LALAEVSASFRFFSASSFFSSAVIALFPAFPCLSSVAPASSPHLTPF